MSHQDRQPRSSSARPSGPSVADGMPKGWKNPRVRLSLAAAFILGGLVLLAVSFFLADNLPEPMPMIFRLIGAVEMAVGVVILMLTLRQSD